MSLWRRAPRQVYRVYGEDEYLSEEPEAADVEYLQKTEDSVPRETRPEIGVEAPPTGSRTPRSVAIGLLLGVTIGAAGLVFSHLSHKTSSFRVGSPGSSALRPASVASSGSVSEHTSGEASARSGSATRSKGRSMSRAPVSGYSPSGSVGRRRVPGSVAPVQEPHRFRQSPPAWMAGAPWRSPEATSVPSEAPGSFAASGGEFEFER